VVVEDSEELMAVWRVLFRRAGLIAKFFTSGHLAFDFISNNNGADILMTDYHLPDTTGLDLIEKVRAIHPCTGCLIVTGNRDSSFIKSVEDPLTAVLFKPVRFPELLAVLEKLALALPEQSLESRA
jgi:DNA-binding NtrC family response regulator